MKRTKLLQEPIAANSSEARERPERMLRPHLLPPAAKRDIGLKS